MFANAITESVEWCWKGSTWFVGTREATPLALKSSHWLLYLPCHPLRTSNHRTRAFKTRYYTTTSSNPKQAVIYMWLDIDRQLPCTPQFLHLEARLPVTRPLVRELQDQDQRYCFIQISDSGWIYTWTYLSVLTIKKCTVPKTTCSYSKRNLTRYPIDGQNPRCSSSSGRWSTNPLTLPLHLYCYWWQSHYFVLLIAGASEFPVPQPCPHVL